jgi:hypothetical protein
MWGEAELLLYCPNELNETMKWQRIQVHALSPLHLSPLAIAIALRNAHPLSRSLPQQVPQTYLTDNWPIVVRWSAYRPGTLINQLTTRHVLACGCVARVGRHCDRRP